jgi:hypothetical protein
MQRYAEYERRLHQQQLHRIEEDANGIGKRLAGWNNERLRQLKAMLKNRQPALYELTLGSNGQWLHTRTTNPFYTAELIAKDPDRSAQEPVFLVPREDVHAIYLFLQGAMRDQVFKHALKTLSSVIVRILEKRKHATAAPRLRVSA